MNPTPPGWPRISAAVFYSDPRQAIDWLCKAFGFEVRLLVEGQNGRVEHSELEYGDGLIMIAGAGPEFAKGEAWRECIASPGMTGGRTTQHLAVHVDDADAHCARARAAGARISYEPQTTDYGEDYWADRSYAAFDLEGHMWWFMQRVRTGGKAHAK
ncbi:MAG: VOC family protein [Planctomycetota bacterium]|nr:VOC family protein [Planctomycetota bacterium]